MIDNTLFYRNYSRILLIFWDMGISSTAASNVLWIFQIAGRRKIHSMQRNKASLVESKNEKLTKGELNFKAHPMLAI